MTEPPARPGGALVATHATATYRDPTENQDRACVLERDGEPVGVTVCDGVGSLPDSAVVAATACEAAARGAADSRPADLSWVRSGFSRAQEEVSQLDDDLKGATTMLQITAVTGLISFDLLGNGALIETCAVAGTGSPPRVRWVNHALPHIDFALGSEALTRSISTGNAPAEAPPRSMIVSRDAGPLQVYLAVTDGILSRENCPTGRVASGEFWESLPAACVGVMQATRDIYDLLGRDPGPDSLAEESTGILSACLAGLADDGTLDDDATVGVVIA